VGIYHKYRYLKYFEPIHSCERYRIDLDNVSLCLLYSYYMYVYCRPPYIPRELVWEGRRAYEALLPKFNGVC
jgi:hypothetical protein